MKTSDELNKLAEALAKAQGEIKNIEKTKIHPHLKSRYADIADGLEVIRPVLAKHSLSLVQATAFNQDTGLFILHTRLMHASGQWVESTYPLPTGGKATDIGSAITYARRYAAFSLVGVAGSTEDDDGVAANNAPVTAKPIGKGKPVGQVSDEAKAELLKKGDEQAKQGTEAFREWWKALSIPDRSAFTTAEINAFKDTAAQVDAGAPEAE